MGVTEEISNHSSFTEKIIRYIRKNQLNTLYLTSLLLGFFIRLFVSLQTTGFLHPDEIYQSLEMAHYRVYDSGIIPPEFQSVNPSQPSYAASRSWIFPLIFAYLMHLGNFIGLDYYNGILPMIKIFLAINATLLIPAVKNFVEIITENKQISVLAAFFVTFWFRIIEYTIRPFYNTFFLPYLFFGLYIVLKTMKTRKFTNSDYYYSFFCIGLVSYIRFDLGIVIFSLFVATFNLEYYKIYFKHLLLGIGAWIAGGYLDYTIYGSEAGFLSVPINWFTFNIIEGLSKNFGLASVFYYFSTLILLDGLIIFLILSIIFYIAIKFFPKMEFIQSIDSQIKIGYKQLFIATFLSWIMYSNPIEINNFSYNLFKLNIELFSESHKEMRFILGGLILMISLFSVLIIILTQYLSYIYFKRIIIISPKITKLHKNQIITWIFSGFLILIIILSIFGAINRTSYEYGHDINKGLMYVGQQDNVDGVIVGQIWWKTGGYTYFHQPASTEMKFHDLSTENIPYRFISDLRNINTNYFVVIAQDMVNDLDLVYSYFNQYNWKFIKLIDGNIEIWQNIN